MTNEGLIDMHCGYYNDLDLEKTASKNHSVQAVANDDDLDEWVSWFMGETETESVAKLIA